MDSESKVNVLLVDDRPENLLALESILEEMPLNIFKANSGNEALGHLISNDFALVLMDVQMPDMDGYETAELMRGSERTRAIPIIFVTAISKKEKNIFRGYEAGAVDFLFKPVQPEILVSKVEVFTSLYRQKSIIQKQVADLTNYKERLEEAVAESKQLAREADQANRAKSDFLANMSHEIRTPLNAIIGMAELLGETRLSSEQKQYVRVFNSAGENLLTLINDILDLSKVEAGHIVLEQTEFSLEAVLTSVCDTLSLKAHGKNLELNSRIVPGTIVGRIGDPTRLRQILLNLASNSIKFTSAGEVSMTVSTLSSGMLRFEVSDTGIGIPPDKLDLIFESFEQADSSTTRKFGGTGLGLAISRRLVELMGGRINVESTEGSGSTFSFVIELPVAADYSASVEDKCIEINLKDLEILIVDDNATNRLIQRETLAGWGIKVTEASDGTTALGILKRRKEMGSQFDLVLLDGLMPGMNGLEVVSKYLSEGATTPSSIMMLTSTMPQGYSSECLRKGVQNCLLKPVRRDDLRKAIEEAISDRSKEVPAEEKHSPAPEEKTERTLIRILAADDSSDNRFLLTAFLKKFPCDLTIVENGQEAVDSFKENEYDIVLMDMQMPVLDGFAATRIIREWEVENGHDATPILALTAYALPEEIKHCTDAGCDSHISKPVRKKKLIQAIQDFTV
ncbi:MAG: response regulator [Candidatus Sabulitectum sp.]|nr:response regulator [Candidatus Sabulitectum sp.]